MSPNLKPPDLHDLFFGQHGSDVNRVHVSVNPVKILRTEKLHDHRRGIVSRMKKHIHLRKVTIQDFSEVPAHPVKVSVGKDTDSHAHVPVLL